MYRVYDRNIEEWRYDIVALQDGSLGVYKPHKFFSDKIKIIFNEEPYVIHYDTGIKDKTGNVIFEGDICKCPQGSYGVVAYSGQTGSYCIFDDNNDLYYVLTDEVGNDTMVIGNVIDGVVIDDADS